MGTWKSSYGMPSIHWHCYIVNVKNQGIMFFIDNWVPTNYSLNNNKLLYQVQWREWKSLLFQYKLDNKTIGKLI